MREAAQERGFAKVAEANHGHEVPRRDHLDQAGCVMRTIHGNTSSRHYTITWLGPVSRFHGKKAIGRPILTRSGGVADVQAAAAQEYHFLDEIDCLNLPAWQENTI